MAVDTPVATRPASAKNDTAQRYLEIRRFTERLCEPLEAEDYVIQTMADISPTRWHIAHTTWFFETFVLRVHSEAYRLFDADFPYLFNSYYVEAGERFPRPQRGLLSRPTVKEIFRYRAYVDEHMLSLLEHAGEGLLRAILPVVEIGLHHEQQHQELMLTDIKHVFSINPLKPVYRKTTAIESPPLRGQEWVDFEAQLYWIGHEGAGFAFDNERPRHRQFLEAFQIATQLVTNGEYLAFMEDGGYTRPTLWLSDGWATVEAEGWVAPLYWEDREGGWRQMTLSGMRDVNPEEPVCHVSYFEADAYSRWANARLAGEAEWEVASRFAAGAGHFVEDGHYHPVPATGDSDAGIMQLFGDVWEWTRSSYAAYPGYRPEEGALGEYNGKFMCNQFVLRGGSCATSRTHIRPTYRNFFPAPARWQFTGIRLARDV